MHRPMMRSGVRLPMPVDVSSPRGNPKGEKMAKKRSRRASPAQAAWRKKFAAIMKSGGFKGKKGKKGKKAKRAAAAREEKAMKHRKKREKKAHASKKHRGRKKHRANPPVTAAAAAKPAAKKAAAKPAAKKPAAKKAAAKPAAKKPAAKKPAAKKPAAKKPAAPRETAAERAKFIEEQFVGDAIIGEQRERSQISARKRAFRKKNQKRIDLINRQLAAVRAKYKEYPKGQRGVPGPATRRILRARKLALNLKKSKYLGNLNAGQQKMLKSSGLLNVRNNPSFGEVFKDLGALAPKLGVHAVALAGAAIAGQKIGEQVCKMMTPKDKAVPTTGFSGFVCNNAVTIGTVGVAVAAYELLKHGSPKTRPFAGAALLGGLAAAFVHASARMKTEKGNLGLTLGLPLTLPGMSPAAAAAAATAVAPAIVPAIPPAALQAPAAQGGFVDVGGRAIAVDGLGSSTLTGSSLGDYMSLSGSTLTGSSLGEYMGLSGSTLTGSSLGEIGQMSEGRQGSRALGAPGDPTVEEFMDDEEDDEGSLSGSIFDD